MSHEPSVERSHDTLVACPHCAGPVDASIEVERGILEILTRLALSPAWDEAKAPRLDAIVTRLVQDYDERVQRRVTREPLCEQPMKTTPTTRPERTPMRRSPS